MKTVSVRAANLRMGDVLNGQRIKAVHKHPYRFRGVSQHPHKLATTGVLVIAPNSNGYKLDTFNFRGDELVVVKRPITNMKYRNKVKVKKSKQQIIDNTTTVMPTV